MRKPKDRARWRRHARETRRALARHVAGCAPCQGRTPAAPARPRRCQEVGGLILRWRGNVLAGEYARARRIAGREQ